MLAVAASITTVVVDDSDEQQDNPEQQDERMEEDKDWSMFNPYVPGADKKLYNSGTIPQ